MSKTILPGGDELKSTPAEIKRYANSDTIRQILRQSRLHWLLKPNRDADFYSNQTLHRYTGTIHNEANYQRVEIRTFPDNNAYAGYAGMSNDSGEFGIVHDIDKWDHAVSMESLMEVVNRTQIGASAKIPSKVGYGLNDDKDTSKNTDNRMAAMLFDPYDGRAYLYSNDDPLYVNNENRSPETKLPLRTVARVGDIPTRITDLKNDLDFVSDPDYRHTDNNFTHSNKFILDNIDDRTFVYPEISRDRDGNLVENYRVGLSGEEDYAESDGAVKYNSQPDLGENPDLGDYGDRKGEGINSHNANQKFSGVNHRSGYLPGIFRSLEELERVDLVHQTRTVLSHNDTPGGRRSQNYYVFDGVWSPTWFDRHGLDDSFMSQSQHPTNMNIEIPDREPVPYPELHQTGNKFSITKLYQWRYNRVTVRYHSKDIIIGVKEPGEEYRTGDILRWSFGDDVILYKILSVGPQGQIQAGQYVDHLPGRIFEQDPSTHGVGIPFTNMSNVGKGAKLHVFCKATITTHATQIKNNLYAYVDVVTSVRSDNTTEWSDIKGPDVQGGLVNVRSTAAYPAYSGVNSGRGGPSPDPRTSVTRFHEHGGNATAGVHAHLFKYVINTQNPTWVVDDGVQVFTGKWVDLGPMGIERPCDIKALYLSNPDTNNFGNYYKFMLDSYFDSLNRVPDSVSTNNSNATSPMYLHMAQRDPEPGQRFTEQRIDPNTSKVITVDITDKVMYVNAATGVMFLYNTSHKNDPSFGYGMRSIGWIPLSGVTTR